MNSLLLTVTQLNTYIKTLFDADDNLRSVMVAGEISNFKNHYSSGHFYFTVKDESSSIKAVMFKMSAQKLRFIPEDGMSIIARGRISVFERDGQYQLYVDEMQPDGAGALNLAFEQMKERLQKEGLFDESRKKKIPACPERVGIITSATGAAIRDIMSVLNRRFPLTKVITAAVKVQGDGACGEIARAIERFNEGKYADVLIVGRGGGSLEELWAFNEERTARAIAASEIPVISAVGHETDFTIADFAADLRAPTPSAAAELAVPDFREHKSFQMNSTYRMSVALERMIRGEREKLKFMITSARLEGPYSMTDICRESIDTLIWRAAAALSKSVSAERSRFSVQAGKLNALSPLRVLARGYSITSGKYGIITEAENILPGERINVKLNRGSLDCVVETVIKETE